MKILFIGFGAVAKCVCHVWKMILDDVSITKAVIIEPEDKIKGVDFPEWLNYNHFKFGLTRENYIFALDKLQAYYKGFDLVIDLSVYVGALEIVDWCQKNKVLYISTAIECWEDTPLWKNSNDNCSPLKICKENIENFESLQKNTLQYYQNIVSQKYSKNSTTALLDMGQNPGCVSIYVKCALDFLADKYDIKANTYAEKAMKLGLETIHISEYDSQITNLKASDEIFYNTWSPIGYVEEANDAVQIGFGSHEDMLPTGVIYGEQIILPLRGMNAYAESYEPMRGKLKGRLISHSENNTLTKYLKFNDYKPSTYYVYDSSKISQDSLEIMKERKYEIQDKFHVLNSNEIISGYDSVGTLLLFKDQTRNFWFGSIVTNDYVKGINININATTIQVAAGILGGINWLLRNKNHGICFPEDVDENPQKFIDKVRPLLGHIYCGFVDYKPKSNKLVDLIVKK